MRTAKSSRRVVAVAVFLAIGSLLAWATVPSASANDPDVGASVWCGGIYDFPSGDFGTVSVDNELPLQPRWTSWSAFKVGVSSGAGRDPNDPGLWAAGYRVDPDTGATTYTTYDFPVDNVWRYSPVNSVDVRRIADTYAHGIGLKMSVETWATNHSYPCE